METETLHRVEGNEIWKSQPPNFSLSLPLSPCAGECPALGVHTEPRRGVRGLPGAHGAGERLRSDTLMDGEL